MKRGKCMGFYNSLKEIYNDTTQIVYGKDLADKIIYLSKILSVIELCLIYIIEKCGVRTLITYNIMFKVPQPICVFLSRYIISIIIVYVVYFLLLDIFIRIIVVEVKVRFEKDMFPIWYTLKDVLRAVFYSVLLLKMSHDMLLCVQGYDVIYGNNVIVYIYIMLYVLIRFVGKIHLHNKNAWYYSTITYTNFFDWDGKRIAEDDKVVYRNQIHRIYNNKGVWWVQDYSGKSTTKLEDAVMDAEGKLKVYYHNMGRKKQEDKI